MLQHDFAAMSFDDAYEFNSDKDEVNWAKHGVSLALAEMIDLDVALKIHRRAVCLRRDQKGRGWTDKGAAARPCLHLARRQSAGDLIEKGQSTRKEAV